MARRGGAFTTTLMMALGLCALLAIASADDQLTIMLSADEHGWMLPKRDKTTGTSQGGVVAVEHMLATRGFTANAPGRLLLSSGDMWTGPVESTLLQGQPMAALMNTLGYRAAALGNHEFDFGVDVLAQRAQEGGFPLLAANLHDDDNQVPSWARSHVVINTGGHRVGIVGLAAVETPLATDRRHLSGLRFLPYAEALPAALEAVRADGADVIIVLMHDELAAALPLLPILRSHGVVAVGLGHRHIAQLHIDDGGPGLDDDVVFCNPGPYWRSLCGLSWQWRDGHMINRMVEQIPIRHEGLLPAPSPAVAATLAAAQTRVATLGDEVLTTLPTPLLRSDGTLATHIMDAWRTTTGIDAAVINRGALRQDIEAGPVRHRDVVSVLPFDNSLFVVELTGAELHRLAGSADARVLGFTVRGGDVFDSHGKRIAPTARVEVVTIGFLVRGGDHMLPDDIAGRARDLAIDWRMPVVQGWQQAASSK